MILKAERNLDNLMFGIRNIRVYTDKENPSSYENSMIFYFNEKDVKIAYSHHDLPYSQPDCAVIEFYDGTRIEIEIDDSPDMLKNIEKLIEAIFKMKMLGTKWEKEHPEKYI